MCSHRDFIFNSKEKAAEFIAKADPPVRAWHTGHIVRVSAENEQQEKEYERIASEIGVAFTHDWEDKHR